MPIRSTEHTAGLCRPLSFLARVLVNYRTVLHILR
ncbi:unnamed protein product [Gemmata massiliana]|uniref:Uncharacterized protein n=1 Tax=Gemmata massiliana TaxID=1210884 RepID=A0A6P2CY77_9BACT|nr:unnamed protein product [Gemmata massiliana]